VFSQGDMKRVLLELLFVGGRGRFFGSCKEVVSSGDSTGSWSDELKEAWY